MTNTQTITVKQTRSFIGRDRKVRNTLKALGLGKIGKVKTLPRNQAVEGLIRRVEFIVEVVES